MARKTCLGRCLWWDRLQPGRDPGGQPLFCVVAAGAFPAEAGPTSPRNLNARGDIDRSHALRGNASSDAQRHSDGRRPSGAASPRKAWGRSTRGRARRYPGRSRLAGEGGGSALNVLADRTPSPASRLLQICGCPRFCVVAADAFPAEAGSIDLRYLMRTAIFDRSHAPRGNATTRGRAGR